ncbi:MAG: hypothetical protein KC656_15860, partial [Myxococcales bacterium]|nr:hypothetical protein [Myxococcales bacterium]
LRDVIDRTTALRQSSARVRTGDHPYLDAHFRWRDLAACCPNPVERRLPGPYDGSGSEIVVDGRTGRCEVWIGADLEPREVLAQHTCPAPPPTSPIAIVTSKPTKRPDRRIDVYSAFPIPRVWAGATASPRGLEPAIGASIGAGSTLVAFYETTPAGRFYGIGSHSLLGDTYEHERGHGMRCRVLHRHWVRPGLLLGRTVKDGLPGWRVRPEVTFGAYANLVVGLPVSWTQDAGWSLGARLGLALALP